MLVDGWLASPSMLVPVRELVARDAERLGDRARRIAGDHAVEHAASCPSTVASLSGTGYDQRLAIALIDAGAEQLGASPSRGSSRAASSEMRGTTSTVPPSSSDSSRRRR